MIKLMRFSLGAYVGAAMLLVVASQNEPRLSLGDVIILPLAVVGLGWMLWAFGAFGEELGRASEFAADGVRAMAVRMLYAPEPEDPPAAQPTQARIATPPHFPPRIVRVNDTHGQHEMTVIPAGESDYRRLVIGFVIRGEQIGSYIFRDMKGRTVDGQRVDFDLWRRVTDESWVFTKGNHGTRLLYPVREAVAKIAGGLRLANEKVAYGLDEIEVMDRNERE